MPAIPSNVRPDIRPIGASGTILASNPSADQGVSWKNLYLADILVNFSITSFNVAPSAVMLGTGVSLFIGTASYNYTPTGVSITSSDPVTASITAPFTSFTFFASPTIIKTTMNDSATFIIQASGTVGGNASATGFTAWQQRQYWGVAADPGVYNVAFMTGQLPNFKFGASHEMSFTLTAGTGQYLWYAYRTLAGTPVFRDYYTNTAGGFTAISTGILFQNEAGYSENYQLWRSDYANLGTIKMNVKDS